jgi:hypothetical protein
MQGRAARQYGGDPKSNGAVRVEKGEAGRARRLLGAAAIVRAVKCVDPILVRDIQREDVAVRLQLPAERAEWLRRHRHRRPDHTHKRQERDTRIRHAAPSSGTCIVSSPQSSGGF